MKFTLSILTLLAFIQQLAFSQILVIDFGTQYIKSAVVNFGTGKSFTIVENHKSERKFINSLGFYNEQRHYEEESLSKRGKFPTNCFLFNKLLIDSSLDPKLVPKIKKDLFLQYIDDNEENQLMAEFVLKNFPEGSNQVTLVEVVAMIMKYARHNAEKQFGIKVKDTVLTIPNYWNIRMRAFITEAAQVADLYLLSLISENTGAAINYALNQRSQNVTEKILFYNLGANSLQMTLVQFKQVVPSKSSKAVESIFVLGDYGASYVGGLRFDNVLYEYFAEKFQEKYHKQLTKRAQIKILDAVVDTKEVLSANKEAVLFVQGLMDGIDYSQRIQRKQFEKRSKHLFDNLLSPVKRFLLEHDTRPQDLTSVQLIGGSVRIPQLQRLLNEEIQNSSKIGTHINGDESMVLGAAFFGANSSKKFKVKGINLYDGFNFEIRTVLRNLDEDIGQQDENYFHKNVTVFKKKDRFGLTKQLNFKCKQNIIVDLYREDESGLELIRSTKLDNIEKVNETDFKVSLTLIIDPIEVVLIKKAEIKYKREQISTYLEKVKKPSSGSEQEQPQQQQGNEKKEQENEQTSDKQPASDKQPESKEESQEESKQDKEQQTFDDDDSDEEEKSKKKEKKSKKNKKKKPKVEYETVQRNKTVTKTYEKELKKTDIYSHEIAEHDITQKSKQMLLEYERVELERKLFHESKNKLESLVYEIFDKLENEEFLEFVSEEQKDKLDKLSKEKSNWLDEADTDSRKQYENQHKQLSKPLAKIKRRIKQFNDREIAHEKVMAELEKYNELGQNITNKKDWIEEDVINQFIEEIEESKEQVMDMYNKMKNTAKSQSAVYLISDFNKVSERVKDRYFKIMAIPEPKKTKKEEKSQQQSEEDSEDQEIENDDL